MSNDHMLLELIRQAFDDLAQHKRECTDERREAARRSDDLSRKVDSGFARSDKKMDALLEKVDRSISAVHTRVNGLAEDGHEREAKAWTWRMKTVVGVGAAVIGALGGGFGFALVQWLLARGVAG